MTHDYPLEPSPAVSADVPLPASAPLRPGRPSTTTRRAPWVGRTTANRARLSAVPAGRRRGPLAFIADRRGLTFVGAVLLAGVLGTVGGAINANSGAWVGLMFTVSFVAGCVLAALLVHREDLLTVALMPPLLFVAVATSVGIAQAVLHSARVKTKVEFQVGYSLSFGAPALWIATIATAVVVLGRFVIRRRPARTAVTPSTAATAGATPATPASL